MRHLHGEDPAEDVVQLSELAKDARRHQPKLDRRGHRLGELFEGLVGGGEVGAIFLPFSFGTHRVEHRGDRRVLRLESGPLLGHGLALGREWLALLVHLDQRGLRPLGQEVGHRALVLAVARGSRDIGWLHPGWSVWKFGLDGMAEGAVPQFRADAGKVALLGRGFDRRLGGRMLREPLGYGLVRLLESRHVWRHGRRRGSAQRRHQGIGALGCIGPADKRRRRHRAAGVRPAALKLFCVGGAAGLGDRAGRCLRGRRRGLGRGWWALKGCAESGKRIARGGRLAGQRSGFRRRWRRRR